MPAPPPVASPSSSRGCAGSAALLAFGLGALLAALALMQPLSWWSWALAVGLLLLGGGALARQRRILAAGATLVLVPWLLRVWLVQGDEHTTLLTLPNGDGARLLSRLYPESDGALAAAALLSWRESLRDPEAAKFPDILQHAYARTEPPASRLPTPAIATYLGLQRPQAFDAVLIRPPEQRVSPDAAVVFLHGYAGNFYVYCWEMAQAAAAANLVTICPSTGPRAAWWEPSGAETLVHTLDYAHRIGMNRIYLAGLSNGAAGASELSLTYRDRLAGVVLVSGARAARAPSLPVLVIQGATDQMMPAASARAYARGKTNVQYHERPGGHFIFLSDSTGVRPVIARFLSGLEQQATKLRRP